MSSALAALRAVQCASDEHAAIAAARTKLSNWLLLGPLQQVRGEHAGAVAGSVDGAGMASYVYPEITGYYLQWLASQALRLGTSSLLAAKAAAAQHWLRRMCERPVPLPTRIYFDATREDWRNGASFAFDLAMVLRGLAWASRAGLLAADALVVARVCALLEELIADDGILRACIGRPGAIPLPARWSTRPGPFLAKAASGVLFAAETLPHIPLKLERCARRTLTATSTWFIAAPHADTHAFFYSAEGLLSRPKDDPQARLLPRLAIELRKFMVDAEQLGCVPESRGVPGKERLDVAAQALRAAWLLRRQWLDHGPEPAFVAKMARFLVRHTESSGALPFDARSQPLQYSAWSAMFAEQALYLAERGERGPVDADADACIV